MTVQEILTGQNGAGTKQDRADAGQALFHRTNLSDLTPLPIAGHVKPLKLRNPARFVDWEVFDQDEQLIGIISEVSTLILLRQLPLVVAAVFMW